MLVNENKIKFKNNLVIIDEIQNMISESGRFYKNIKDTIMSSDSKNKNTIIIGNTNI